MTTRRALIAAPLCAWAQDPGLRVRSRAEQVLIPATVTDTSDRLVTGLRRENFRIYEERREQTLASFALENVPVSITVLWDVSRSMAHAIDDVRRATRQIIDSLEPDDDLSLIVFADVVIQQTPFVNSPDYLRSAVARAETSGGTALWDALAAALASKGRHRRRAILLFTDGGERDSRRTRASILRTVREAGVRVYTFGPLPWRPVDSRDATLLEEIASDSGGRSFYSRHLMEHVRKLELHSEYVLGYVPPESPRDGRYRRVGLRLVGVAGKLRACWRRGYYAPLV